MNDSSTRLGVIVPCHNDGSYLRRVLASVARSASPFDSRIIVVLDRCTDDSLEVASSFDVESVVKERATWRNSTAENLEMGFLRLLDLEYVAVIAADTVVPPGYFRVCVDALEASPDLTSVSAPMFTERTTLFNKAYWSYEVLIERLGLKHGIRGSGRVYRMSAIRRLHERTGFIVSDVLAEDTFLDETLGGSRKILEGVSNVCVRRSGFGKSMRGQLTSGMARRQLALPPIKVIGELARLRFLVPVGFLLYPLVRDDAADSIVSALGRRDV